MLFVVTIGDGESARIGVVDEVFPAIVDIVAGATLHEAVLGLVELVLSTEGEVVDTGEVAHFVGDNGGLHVTEVTIGERVGTEAGVDSRSAVLEGLQNIDGGEEVAHEATRLVLVRVGGTQHVVATAAQEAVVPFGSDRAEVLLLEVTVALEIHGVFRGTAVGVTVVDATTQRIDGA